MLRKISAFMNHWLKIKIKFRFRRSATETSKISAFGAKRSWQVEGENSGDEGFGGEMEMCEWGSYRFEGGGRKEMWGVGSFEEWK